MQNRIHIAMLCCIVTMALASCHRAVDHNADDSVIEANAKGYIEAMANYRVDDARPYATPETQTQTLDFFKKVLENIDSNAFKDNLPAEVTITGIKHVSDTHAVVRFHKKTPTRDFYDSVHVKLRDGQWLVNQPLMQNTADTNRMQRKPIDPEMLKQRAKGPRPVDTTLRRN